MKLLNCEGDDEPGFVSLRAFTRQDRGAMESTKRQGISKKSAWFREWSYGGCNFESWTASIGRANGWGEVLEGSRGGGDSAQGMELDQGRDR